MPTGSISADWGILANVGIDEAKDYRDGLAVACGYLEAMERAGARKKWNSGGRRATEINMFNHTGITVLGSGYEEFDPTAVEGSRVAYYSPALSGLLMKIGIKEIQVYGNSTAGLTPVVKKRTTACMGFLQRNWNQRIVAGIGSGFTDWGTFNGIDFTTGIFERAAVGSQTNTVGGLSKATYNFAIGWNNVVVDMSNQWGSNLTQLYAAITGVKAHKANLKSKVWLFSQAGMNNIKRSVQANERYYIREALDAGEPVELYHGIRIHQENFMPVSTATGGSSTNTYPITAYLIDAEDIFPEWSQSAKIGEMELPDGYFGTGVWRPVSGEQMVACCPMVVGGQLITTDMGSSAVVIRGQTF